MLAAWRARLRPLERVLKFGAGVAAMVLTMLAVAPSQAADLADAKIDYTTYCAQCHGESGRGNGPSAAKLSPKPRNFSDCALMASIPDTILARVIRDGGSVEKLNPAMPSWRGVLTAEQIDGLVAYVRSFCKRK